MRFFIPAALFLLLAACDHSQKDMDRCADYGFQPGTEGFAACRMQVAENRRAMGAVMLSK